MKNGWMRGLLVAVVATIGMTLHWPARGNASVGTPLSANEMRATVGGDGWGSDCWPVSCPSGCPPDSTIDYLLSEYSECQEDWPWIYCASSGNHNCWRGVYLLSDCRVFVEYAASPVSKCC